MVQVTNTRVDQRGFQGISILGEILGMLFSRELLQDLANLNGVSLLQRSLYTMGNNNIVEEALARFGKISMEFLHLGGLQGYQNSCLKGAGDEYSHGPMRSTVWVINWGKLTYGEKWTYGSLQSRFGKIWRKAVYSSCPR